MDNNTTNSIVNLGTTETNGKSGNFYCLSIIGQIEGHYILDQNQKSTKYDHILPLLLELEENDKIDGIVMLINTLGGDVEAGLALAELLHADPLTLKFGRPKIGQTCKLHDGAPEYIGLLGLFMLCGGKSADLVVGLAYHLYFHAFSPFFIHRVNIQ